jgi:hypothetical protein
MQEAKEGKLTSVTVYSLRGSACKLRYGEIVTPSATNAGGQYVFNGELRIQQGRLLPIPSATRILQRSHESRIFPGNLDSYKGF